MKKAAIKKKSPKTWQKQLGLDSQPDQELVSMLEQLRDDTPKPKVKSAKPKEGITLNDLETLVQGAVIAHSVGDLLAKARRSKGLTLSHVGKRLGLSKGRIGQLEQPEANLEIQTLVRQADVLGFNVVVTLKPKGKGKDVFSSELRV